MPGMRRLILVTAALFLILLFAPTADATIVPCLFDEGTGEIDATTEFGGVQIHLVNGNEIYANAQPCGGATTSTADSIAIAALSGDEVEITLADGPFAPGATVEADGSSEIEFEITGGPVYLTITGSSGADRLSAGFGAADTDTFNLNADETVDDADVVVHRDVLLAASLDLGGGADSVRAGDPGTGDDLAFIDPLEVEGGAGADLIEPGIGSDSAYWGDTQVAAVDDANDTLTLATLPMDCVTLVHNEPLGETSLLCDGAEGVTYETSYFETLVGHDGEDWFFGAGWGEDLRGGGGDDRLIPGLGRDHVRGGPGWDYLITGEHHAVHVDLTAGKITGEGRDHPYAGVEGIFSMSDDADVFAGGPPPGISSLSGGGGANVLDLRGATRGYDVISVDTVAFAPASPQLFATGFPLIFGSPFDDRISGGPNGLPNGIDEFRGAGGDDHLDGGPGPDTLYGGTGDDVIIGGVGTDTCNGGPGFDIVSSCER
jgi:Ca2+-binding RTX toxin-like protein